MRTTITCTLFVCLFSAFAAYADCGGQYVPHSITGNFSTDLYGPADIRPGTVGVADVVVKSLTFKNVPSGCRVKIMKMEGDFVAWPSGTYPSNTPAAVPTGTHAGVLFGMYRTSATGSQHADYAADGYYVYFQGSTEGQAIRIHYKVAHVEGPLDPDNILQFKMSDWMNNTGQIIHMEITFSQILFQYVPISSEVKKIPSSAGQEAHL